MGTYWRWQFWVTLFPACLTYVIASWSVRYPVPRRKQGMSFREQLREVDFLGCFLILGMWSTTLIAMSMGNKRYPWNVGIFLSFTSSYLNFGHLIQSFPIIILLAFGALLVPWFVIHEFKAKHPIVDLRLFANRNIPVACAINFFTGAAYFGAIVFLPQYFIFGKGSSPFATGGQMLGMVLSIGLSSLLAARALSSSGKFRFVGSAGGMLYTIGATLMLTIEGPSSYGIAVIYSILLGIGAGIMFLPAALLGPMLCRPHQAAIGAGLLAFCRTLGGMFAVVLSSNLLQAGFTGRLREKIPDELLRQGLRLAEEQSLYPEFREQINKAVVWGYRLTNIPAAAVGVIYAVALLTLRNVDFDPNRGHVVVVDVENAKHIEAVEGE